MPIRQICNLSIKYSAFPIDCKIAKLKPIFKKGLTIQPNNYRPISSLPLISKIIERIVHNQLQSHLDNYDILYKYQFGFRSNHDTNQPVIHLMDKIYEGLNKDMPEYTLGIFLDLKKAFDTKLKHGILKDRNEFYQN